MWQHTLNWWGLPLYVFAGDVTGDANDLNEWLVCFRLYYDVSKRKLALMRDGLITTVSGLMLLPIICVHRYRTSETFHGVNMLHIKTF